MLWPRRDTRVSLNGYALGHSKSRRGGHEPSTRLGKKKKITQKAHQKCLNHARRPTLLASTPSLSFSSGPPCTARKNPTFRELLNADKGQTGQTEANASAPPRSPGLGSWRAARAGAVVATRTAPAPAPAGRWLTLNPVDPRELLGAIPQAQPATGYRPHAPTPTIRSPTTHFPCPKKTSQRRRVCTSSAAAPLCQPGG